MGNIYKKIDMSIDDKKQSEKSINPATKGFLIEMHKSNIKNLNSEYNDLIIKSKDYNLTFDQRKEIDNRINHILNDIKINENKIDEINKLKSNKELEILEKKDSNIPVGITKLKQSTQGFDIKKLLEKKEPLSKLDSDNMLEMLEGKEVTPKMLEKKEPLSKLDSDNMLEMLEGKEVTPKILEKKDSNIPVGITKPKQSTQGFDIKKLLEKKNHSQN